MALGSVNVPGAEALERRQEEAALLARIASAEKTLSGMEKIPGSVPPTPQVTAKVGQIYINVVTGEQWKCVAVSDSGSAWEKVVGSGTALSAADVGAVPIEEKAKPGGVATLDDKGKVQAAQLPASMPASDVPAWAKQPTKPTYTAPEVGAKESGWSAFHAGTSAPADKTKLWIDTTAGTGGLKYWTGSAWTTVPVAYS